MIRSALFIPASLLMALAVSSTAGAADKPVALWAGAPPGEIPPVPAGAAPEGRMKDPLRLTDVATPTLTWYRPEKPDGRALIVCPGGGYGILSVIEEGSSVASRFARGGLTVVQLNYRVPVKNTANADAAPRHDLAEALRQVRADLMKRGFEKPSVGVLGFSAGGHLALEAAYGPMPANSPRPDFVVAVYPAYLLEKSGALKKDFAPDKDSPPACFVHAADDPWPAEGGALLWASLNRSGVKSEAHLYAAGGHGFGITPAIRNRPVGRWPDAVEAWMDSLPKTGR